MITYKEFKHDFSENRYHLSRTKSAAFSAIVVAFCIAAGHFFRMGSLAAVFIIAAQSVTGINRQGPFRIRLSIAIKTAVILSFSALLGMVAMLFGVSAAIVCGVLLAFSFAWWRQLFPFNWPDIVIPSGVLFFMNYMNPAVALTLFGAVVGVLCELLLGIAIYVMRHHIQAEIPPKEAEILLPEAKSDSTVWGLKSYLFLYWIELSLLLCIGFVIMHFTSYPHAYWMPLTVIIVLKVGRHATFKRVVERTLGTLAGCLLGGVLLYIHMNVVLLSASMVACIFIWLYYLRYRYAIGTVFITTFIFIMLNGNESLSFSVIAERMVFTVLGGVLALLSSFVFLRKERLQA